VDKLAGLIWGDNPIALALSLSAATDEQIDRGAALEDKRVVHKNERRDLSQQVCGLE
jgi:hypothetical protein